MAQDTSGSGSATGGGTMVIPGEMAARIDRLPASWMVFELALIVQLGWSTTGATDGIAATLYPFIWLPEHTINHSQYSVLYAFQTGISILLGGYFIGWLGDKIGRRRALILSTFLGAVFIVPFGYVTNYPALIFLSIGDTLGFAGFLALNVVYTSEMAGPVARSKVIMYAQVLAIVLGLSIWRGVIPHFMVPGQYRPYLWLLGGLNLIVMLLLVWRLPESPRWLEARGQTERARRIVERMEARVMKRHPVLPEPDLTPHEVVAEEKTSMFAVYTRQFVFVTILLLVVMALGYGGIIYGNAGYAYLFLAESRGYGAGFVFALTAWAGIAGAAFYVLNALVGDRVERKYTQLGGAIIFAGAWYGIYNVHATPAVVVLFMAQEIGLVLWLWSMYTYIPANYPTRMRGLGTGWTDGIGHLGAWGGVLLCGVVFTAGAPLGWILLITIPGALLPAVLVGVFGVGQRRRALEEMAR
jgi:MFS family permease